MLHPHLAIRILVALAFISVCNAFSSPLSLTGVQLRRAEGIRCNTHRAQAAPNCLRSSKMQYAPKPTGESTSLTETSTLRPSPTGFASLSLVLLAALVLHASPALAVDASQLPPGVVAKPVFEPRGITQQDLIVFGVCCFPFLWATVEFWRRIAVGEPFGTGKDSVVITDLPDAVATAKTDAEDGNTETPSPAPTGRRTLTVGAIRVAYGLFAAVGGTVVLVGLAAYQVMGSAPAGVPGS